MLFLLCDFTVIRLAGVSFHTRILPPQAFARTVESILFATTLPICSYSHVVVGLRIMIRVALSALPRVGMPLLNSFNHH